MKLISSSEGMYYEGFVFFHHKTERALLVSKTGNGADSFWLPISQCINDPIPVQNEDDILEVEICIPEWLAIKTQLI